MVQGRDKQTGWTPKRMGPVTVSVLEIAIPLPFIARRSPRATKLQRRVLGGRAEPHPALTLGAMKHTRPFITRRPGPGVAGETAPGAGPIVPLLLPLLSPMATPRPGAGASLRARLGMGALLLIDRPSTRSGSGSRNRKRTLSSSVGVRGARATFATAVPGCGWRGRINCHRPNRMDRHCQAT